MTLQKVYLLQNLVLWDNAKRGDFAIFLLRADKASKVTPPPAPVPEEVINN